MCCNRQCAAAAAGSPPQYPRPCSGLLLASECPPTSHMPCGCVFARELSTGEQTHKGFPVHWQLRRFLATSADLNFAPFPCTSLFPRHSCAAGALQECSSLPQTLT